MPPKLALILCVLFVLGLLRIERENNPNASLALWIPTIWMLICGSKPVGSWFVPESASMVRSLAAGNPINQFSLAVLFVLSLVVLIRRKAGLFEIIKDNKWLFLLYAYMGLSILWSETPSISFRRWIKVSITLVVAPVILTELSPAKALESILRRCAYVLIPFSMLLIKYYPYLGRQYNRWTGGLMWTGVAGQKNGLGLLCTISIFFFIWSYLYNKKTEQRTKMPLVLSDTVILVLAAYLLFGNRSSYSATSIFILIVGTFMLLVFSKIKFLGEWVGKKLTILIIIGVLGYALMNSALLPIITSSLGRDTSLTGRTEIWSTAVSIVHDRPILGLGYGNLAVEEKIYNEHGVLQSHNGYIGVWVYLGMVGLALLAVFFLRFAAMIDRSMTQGKTDWTIFGICYLFMLLLYNYTESTFLGTSLTWTLIVFLCFLFSKNSTLILPKKVGRC